MRPQGYGAKPLPSRPCSACAWFRIDCARLDFEGHTPYLCANADISAVILGSTMVRRCYGFEFPFDESRFDAPLQTLNLPATRSGNALGLGIGALITTDAKSQNETKHEDSACG